jgi:transposase
MTQPNDLSRSRTPFCQESTLIVVVDMSQSSWLVAGIVPGIERHPLKKLDPDEDALLQLIQRWRDEAVKVGRPITRIALAFEAGRDGFWLARWLRMRDIESYVIHSTSVAVPREHRRAKTDRLDSELLERIVGPDLQPVDVREGVVGQCLGDAALDEIGRGVHLGRA